MCNAMNGYLTHYTVHLMDLPLLFPPLFEIENIHYVCAIPIKHNWIECQLNPQDTTEALQMRTMQKNSEQVLGTLHWVMCSIRWCGFYLSSKLQISHMFRIFSKSIPELYMTVISITHSSLMSHQRWSLSIRCHGAVRSSKCKEILGLEGPLGVSYLTWGKTSIPDVCVTHVSTNFHVSLLVLRVIIKSLQKCVFIVICVSSTWRTSSRLLNLDLFWIIMLS